MLAGRGGGGGGLCKHRTANVQPCLCLPCVSWAQRHQQLPSDPNRKLAELSGGLACVSAAPLSPSCAAAAHVKNKRSRPKKASSFNFNVLTTDVVKQYVCRLGGRGGGDWTDFLPTKIIICKKRGEKKGDG